jgi:hypothetical protein
MTTELTQPQSELGQAPAEGQGQLQGHRHRRRRRKNKNSPVNAVQVQQPQSKVESQTQVDLQQPSAKRKMAPARQGGRPSGHQNHGKKKKFFPKRSVAAAQPGSNVSAPLQGKRKSRQKNPKEFVGPMDHNYGNRAVNGNIADSPTSTTLLSENGYRSDGYEDIYQPLPPASVREDAPTRIFCFIEDLFFLAKIQETARKLGVKVEFVKGDKETVTRLTTGNEAERPALLLFDLNNLSAKPMTLIPKFRTKLKKATSIIGFLSRLQGDLRMKAVEAGCDTVMTRAAFSQSLPTLLRRYGIEEIEEEEEEMSQPEEMEQVTQPV